MKNQSISLAYNAQAQKFYIVINGVTGDDPIKDAILALVQGVSNSNSTEIAAIEGLELESVPVMDDDMTVAADTPVTVEAATVPAETDTPADNDAPAVAEAPAAASVEASAPDAAAKTPVADKPSEPSGEPTDADAAISEPVAEASADTNTPAEGYIDPNKIDELKPSAETSASAIFKMRAGVPLVGVLVKTGKAVLNRADSTITVSDAQAVKDLAEAGLERIG